MGKRTSSVQVSLPSEPSRGFGGRVLVAEDAPETQILIAACLRALGATVRVVGNGRIAVENAREALRDGCPYDVILMDMQMPELDGYDATARLRREGYRGAIVALTAHGMTGDREKCLAAGCDEYLTKPIDRKNFNATVARFITGSRVQVGLADTVQGPITVSSRHSPLVSELTDDPDMAGILAEFLQTLGRRAAALECAILHDDKPALMRLAHQLKGAAGGYGFPSITEQAKVVGQALESGDRELLIDAVDMLCTLCLRARDGGSTASGRGTA
jgi:CheY-like chemotaxis protein/HPt (histidine-containing phosphotransfer) domain-containing protein